MGRPLHDLLLFERLAASVGVLAGTARLWLDTIDCCMGETNVSMLNNLPSYGFHLMLSHDLMLRHDVRRLMFLFHIEIHVEI